MIMVTIESMMRRRIEEMIFRFMGRRIRIMTRILRGDRMMIGVIFYRIISNSSDKREDRYEKEIMLDLWIC